MIIPFRVEWVLRTPITVPENPIHLDALLAWAAVDEAREAGSDAPFEAQHELPLERHGDPWCFMGSALVFPSADPVFPMHMTRPTRVTEYADGRAFYPRGADKLTLGTGRHKAFLFTRPMARVRNAIAYGIGDPERTRELLARVRGIGAMRRNFAGDVESCVVTADEAANTAWKRRVLPWQEDGYAQIQATFRPPYWRRGSQVVAYIPPEIMR